MVLIQTATAALTCSLLIGLLNLGAVLGAFSIAFHIQALQARLLSHAILPASANFSRLSPGGHTTTCTKGEDA